MIAGRAIGRQPVFIIAEAGVNHNGDPALAHRLVDAAADAGADAVKFQTFDASLVAAATAPKAEYQRQRAGAEESQRDMLQRLTLPADVYPALAAHAADRRLIFLSTPFDLPSADFLFQLGLPAFKIPSGEITNVQLLRHVASYRRPLLMSTGMATLDEVSLAVDTVRRAGTDAIALFHCVSNYPAAAADCNLRAMATMRTAFEVPVGWSDHTDGLEISLAAVAAGAELLEKHLTLDRTLPGPDHAASLEPGELRRLVQEIRVIEAALGDGVKRPTPSELPMIPVVRRSIHAARALAAGTELTSDDLVMLRPGTGMPPAALERLVGRRLVRSVRAGDRFADDDVH